MVERSVPMPVTTKVALTRTRATKLRDSGSSVERNVISAHTSCKQYDGLAHQDGAKQYPQLLRRGWEFGVAGRIN